MFKKGKKKGKGGKGDRDGEGEAEVLRDHRGGGDHDGEGHGKDHGDKPPRPEDCVEDDEREECKKGGKKGKKARRFGAKEGTKYRPQNCKTMEGDAQFECFENEALSPGNTIGAGWFQPKPSDDYKMNYRIAGGMDGKSWCRKGRGRMEDEEEEMEGETMDDVDVDVAIARTFTVEGASTIMASSVVILSALSLF